MDQKIDALSMLKDEIKALNSKFEQYVLRVKDDNTWNYALCLARGIKQ